MNCCQGLGSKMLRCRTFKVKLRLDRLSVLKADRSSTTIYIPVKALGCFRLRFVISSSWAASAQFAFVLPDVPQACQNVFDTSLYQSQKKTKYTNTRQANVEPAKQMQTLLNPTCTPLQNLQTPNKSHQIRSNSNFTMSIHVLCIDEIVGRRCVWSQAKPTPPAPFPSTPPAFASCDAAGRFITVIGRCTANLQAVAEARKTSTEVTKNSCHSTAQ